MISTQTKTFLKVSLLCVVFIAMTANLLPVIYHNGSGTVYNETDNGESLYSTQLTIGSCIEYGAASFLDANSIVLSFSEAFEMAGRKGVDFDGWLTALNSAIDKISSARYYYDVLIKKADEASYNWNVAYKLWTFDYYDFVIREKLNREIFEEVYYYLYTADITGIYRHSYKKFCEIEELLVTLKKAIELKSMPPVKTIWRLNELCASTLTSGQYVARVFYEIN